MSSLTVDENVAWLPEDTNNPNIYSGVVSMEAVRLGFILAKNEWSSTKEM
jgi:hypothetical protein